jgi:hypothetical protein
MLASIAVGRRARWGERGRRMGQFSPEWCRNGESRPRRSPATGRLSLALQIPRADHQVLPASSSMVFVAFGDLSGALRPPHPRVTFVSAKVTKTISRRARFSCASRKNRVRLRNSPAGPTPGSGSNRAPPYAVFMLTGAGRAKSRVEAKRIRVTTDVRFPAYIGLYGENFGVHVPRDCYRPEADQIKA